MLQDLRYAFRTIVKNPGFALVAVLALALGIGANSAIFSVVYAVLLRPLPVRDPGNLVVVHHSYPNLATASVSPANYQDYLTMTRAFESMGADAMWSANLTGIGEPERLVGRRVTASYFSTLGVAPAMGRAFLNEEDRAGANKVAILGHGFWQRRLGGDPTILNQTINLNGAPYTVVGVMPDGFRTDRETDVMVPMAFTPDEASPAERGYEFVTMYARLRPGFTIDAARKDMNSVADRLRAAFYPPGSKWGVSVIPLREELVGDMRGSLLTLFAAVGLVLLIACANVASLLLARAAVRRREIAIRRAIGATQARLVRLLLTESVLLALMGGAVGLLAALWGSSLLINALPTELSRDIPGWDRIAVNLPVLGFTFGVAMLTGILFGLMPALQTSRQGLSDSLKEGSRGSEGAARHRARHALVVAEFALSLVLLIGAGLLVRSFWRVQQVNPGFDPNGLLTFSISLPSAGYPNRAAVGGFYGRLLDEIRAIPGVQSAGAVSNLPLSGDNQNATFFVEGLPVPTDGEAPHGDPRSTGAGYFEAMRIPLLRGRYLSARDAADSTFTAVIDENLAQKYFPGQDPIGHRIGFGGKKPVWREIVGVVAHVKHYGLDGRDLRSEKVQYYFPVTQYAERSMYVVVRGSGEPAELGLAIRAAVSRIDSAMPIYAVRTMERVREQSLAQRRLLMTLLAVFAALALALAAVGIYGVMSYGVAQRVKEIGIRMALGARPGDVLRMVAGQGLALAAIGAAIGICGGWGVARLMNQLLFGISAADPLTFLGVPLLLGVVALAATWFPARRATKVDPLVALRDE